MAVVLFLMWRWQQDVAKTLHAVGRMLLQLALIGYVLVYIFQANSAWLISAVLAMMVVIASWIALNTADRSRSKLYPAALVSIAVGGGSTLLLITQWVLKLEPWYLPSYMVPLAGMIFSAGMTNISIALERLLAETENGRSYPEARATAFRASMIPVINSFFAVGLISLPGMMTGQILSGVSPLIAARYQVMVMCMIFGAAGLATVVFLILARRVLDNRS